MELKLARAKEHLLQLNSLVGAYLSAEENFKLVLNRQPSNPRLVLVEFHVREQPPQKLGVIVGDCLHNMRSALDHLAWQCVLANNGTPTRNTYFPIHYKGAQLNPKSRKPLSIEGSVSKSVIEFIGLKQPYHDAEPQANPLAILDQLTNIDKHRMLHVATGRIINSQVFLVSPDGARIGGFHQPQIAKDQMPIAAFEFSKPFEFLDYPEIEISASGETFVSVDGSETWANQPISFVLEKCLNRVHHVLKGVKALIA